MKIVFLDRKTLGHDISIENFSELGEVTSYDMTSPEDTASRLKDADIAVTNKVVIDEEIMKNTNLKLICITATGMNNVDLEYAKENNIGVKNVAGYSTASVAQLTISFALDFIQKLDFYKSYVDEGNWQKSDIFTNLDKPFFELNNKKWGIIGLGNIGEGVAKIADAFGCEVSFYSTSGSKREDTPYIQKELDELLSECDVISIHCPLNDDTLNLLDKQKLQSLKDGAILINLGRGGIINEQDLAEVIEQKEIYCALDVVSKEPIEANSPLLSVKAKDRLTITPHIGWASIEARQKLLQLVYNNIKEFMV